MCGGATGAAAVDISDAREIVAIHVLSALCVTAWLAQTIQIARVAVAIIARAPATRAERVGCLTWRLVRIMITSGIGGSVLCCTYQRG
jgi:hypothetical protein